MGAIVFAAFFLLAIAVAIPAYAAIDWYFSCREKETFKEYFEKF